MYRAFGIALSVLISFNSFAQKTTITIDISELDRSGYDNLVFRTNHGFKGVEGKDYQNIKVDKLPTLVELFVSQGNISAQGMYIWVTKSEIKISGSIEKQTLTVSPRAKLQNVADEMLLGHYIKKKNRDILFSEPNSLLVYRGRLRSTIKEIQEYVAKAPTNLHDFWGFQKIQKYLDAYKKAGYDPKTKTLSHFEATLENGEEIFFKPPKNKPLFISFLAVSCNCVEEIKQVSNLKNSLKNKLEIVTLWHSDSGVPIGLYLNNENEIMSWTSLWDEDILITRKLEIKGESEYILFGTDGKIIKRWKKPPKNLRKYL